MNSEEILKFCLERGILIDKEVLDLFSGAEDREAVKFVLGKLKESTQERVITRRTFTQSKEGVENFFSGLPEENRRSIEKLKIKLGLSIEISKEVSKEAQDTPLQKEAEMVNGLKIFSIDSFPTKKLEVPDFVNYFRNRFNEMKNILQNHSGMEGPVSINKIFGNNQKISLIGLVADKKVTKNNNIILEVEDLTGKIKLIVGKNKKEIYEKAEEICLDSVVGFKCSGNREVLFVNDIVFPDSALPERKKSPVEEYALFIGDLHFGSKRFLEKSFLKFIDYLNGKFPNIPEVEKIKYLFIVGDLITGVGNYPGQERDLVISDLEEQFSKLAELFSKIRPDLKIILSPGNHDGVRLMEPQPVLDEKYAWALYNLKNLTFTTNPCYLNISSTKDFSGFNVLTYHGFSFPFYANNVSHLMRERAMNSPDKIMTYLLKNRHLAPTHTSTQYFPSEKDPLLIRNVPDIFVSAHTHKSAVSYYNNVLLVSTSCWEAMTPYQEKFGNTPDHCKVPLFNLKTRAIKILDFEEDEDE